MIESIGKRIRERRISLGLSQWDLATKLGIQQTSVSKIEDGRIKNPRNLKLIAKILDVPEAWLKYGLEPTSYAIASSGQPNKEHNIGERIPVLVKKIPILRWEDFSGMQDDLLTSIARLLSEREQQEEVLTMHFTEKENIGNKLAAIKAENIDAMMPTFPHRLVIFPDDILIIDFDREPKNGSIVLIEVNGDVLVRQYAKDGSTFVLKALNPQYPIITLQSAKVLGVVIKKLTEFK